MKILVCDDEINTATEISQCVSEYMQSKAVDCKIDVSSNPKEILDNNSVYQLAFLDIQMGKIDGLTLAKALKSRNSKTVIFFVTSFKEYLDDAMEIRAYRFFEKPIDRDRLFLSLDRAMEYMDESYVDFYIYTNNEHKQILTDDVIYVERCNRQVTLVTTHGNYTTRETFDEWCSNLQSSFFFRVHASFIVNLHYVTRYKYKEIWLHDNIRIPVAPRRQADFHKFWFAYLRRR